MTPMQLKYISASAKCYFYYKTESAGVRDDTFICALEYLSGVLKFG